jgi:hypothetical protein
MRRAAIWDSVHVQVGDVEFIDTSDPHDLIRFEKHRGGDPIPRDVVLAVLHPADIARFKRYPTVAIPYPYLDINSRTLASQLITIACQRDPELGKKLRWT